MIVALDGPTLRTEESRTWFIQNVSNAMSKIPKALLKEILADEWYKTCCLKGSDCSGRIEFHHNLIFGGRQVQAKFAILPLCHAHHEDANWTEVKEKLDHIMLTRASNTELVKYSKATNLLRKLDYFNGKYGTLWLQ